MEALKVVAAFLATHMTKILGTAQTVVAAILGAAAAKQIPDLVAVDSPAFQWFVLANILLGGATIARGFNNSAQVKVATAIENALQATPPPPKQGGFARLGMLLFVAIASMGILSGCASIDQRLNTGAKIHAAATRSVTGALDAHVISSKDAESYNEIAVNASEVLDSARDLKDIDPKTAEGKVQLANGILQELQQFLVKQLEKQK